MRPGDPPGSGRGRGGWPWRLPAPPRGGPAAGAGRQPGGRARPRATRSPASLLPSPRRTAPQAPPACKYSCHKKCEAKVVIPCGVQARLEQVRPLHFFGSIVLSCGTKSLKLGPLWGSFGFLEYPCPPFDL
nr:tensin-3 isoform X3 [Chlorocebus sabaeus]